jgi:hypothetical protein
LAASSSLRLYSSSLRVGKEAGTHEIVELTRTTVTGAAVLEVPIRNILWVEEGEDGAVQISALVKKGKKHSLRQLDGVAIHPAAVAEWAATLMITAYDGTHTGFVPV